MKILNGGTSTGRLNLLLVSEGYQEGEMHVFEENAETLARAIQREPWYSAGLLNIETVRCYSEESGFGVAPGQGPRETAFKFELGKDGGLDRLISGDDAAVWREMEDYWDSDGAFHVGVLCHSPKLAGWGGPRGRMFWVATGAPGKVISTGMPTWCDFALHELGHSLFGLGDEYQGEGTQKRTWPAAWPEPEWPNVTKDPTGAKWRDIVEHSPFEGAGRYDKGLYRPTATCRMRAPGRWCPVCEDAVRRELESYLTEPDVPEEPSISTPTFTVATDGGMASFPANTTGVIQASNWLLKKFYG